MSHSHIRQIVVHGFFDVARFRRSPSAPVCRRQRPRPDLEKLVGQPADIAPSAYQYRADRKPEENPPESWIGLMKYAGLPFDKAVDVNAPALKKVLCGLIWEEVRRVRRVALVWNGDAAAQAEARRGRGNLLRRGGQGKHPHVVEHSGHFAKPTNRRCPPTGARIPSPSPWTRSVWSSACAGSRMPRPTKSPRCGLSRPIVWKKMDLEIEWGFDKATAASDYSGRIEAYDGIVDRVRPLAGDAGTTMKGRVPTGGRRRKRDGRRGVQSEPAVPGHVEMAEALAVQRRAGRRRSHHRHRLDQRPGTSPFWRRTWRRDRSSRRSTASSCAPRSCHAAQGPERSRRQAAARPEDGRASRRSRDLRGWAHRRRYAVVWRQRHGPAGRPCRASPCRLAAWPCIPARTATWPSAGAARSTAE